MAFSRKSEAFSYLDECQLTGREVSNSDFVVPSSHFKASVGMCLTLTSTSKVSR